MYRGLLHLRYLLEQFYDVIFLPPARSVRTEQRTLDDIPISPSVHELLGERITTLLQYRTPSVEDLIRSIKYDGNHYAAHIAAQTLADFLREEIANARNFSPRPIVLIPIPLHASRERERGFNQVARVLEELPQEFHDGTLAFIITHALARTRATRAQTKLARAERIKNIKGAFEVVDTITIEDAHVVLIDDVTTTGATLASAATALRKTGAMVSLIALARA
jgi:ComF family protein